MSEHDDSHDPDRALIRDAKEEAWHARRALRRELPSPAAETRRELVCALADLRDLLVDYRGHRALDRPWDEREPDVDLIPRLLTETRDDVVARGRTGDPAEVNRTLAAEQADPQKLIALGKELDAIAKELGFAAEARDPTPGDEAGLDDLRGLLAARDQESALDQLPDEQ